MKKICYLYFCLMCSLLLANRSKLVTPYFSMRSQALSSFRNLAGWANYINLPNQGKIYGASAVSIEYTRSWKAQLITNWLFGRDLTRDCREEEHLVISGSEVPDRNIHQNWLADYFGLPTDFISHVFFTPQVKNEVVDATLFVGLDNWHPGAYFFLHAPVVRTKRRLGMKERIINAGSNNHRPGYFTPMEIPREDLLGSFQEFVHGCRVPHLPDNVIFEPLKFARMTTRDWKEKTGFAEIEIASGWNFLLNEDYHLGINLRCALPAGSKPEGIFLFEPIVGNGHHWLAGGGLTLHATLWSDAYEAKLFNAYLDANLYHLSKNQQIRFFDIKNKNNSRYMLAQRFDLPIDNGLRGSEDVFFSFQIPEAQFKSVYTSIVNLTTFRVNIKSRFQTDVTVMAHYQSCSIGCDFGYNFWYRSCEVVEIDPDCLPPKLVQKNWVIKGDAQMYGYIFNDGSSVALSASQSEADIHTGLNFGPGRNVIKGIANGGTDADDRRTIDNPIPAFSDTDVLVSQPGGANPTNTSIPPRFIRPSSVDVCSASTESTIHTLFIYSSYEGRRWWQLIPYIGLGGKISYAFQDNNPFKQVNVSRCQNACSESQCVSCRPCLRECLGCGICEWGWWVKGGIAF